MPRRPLLPRRLLDQAQELRLGARRAVRAPVPATLAVDVPVGDVSQRRARQAAALALRIGEAQLDSSASASEVVATALRIMDAYEIRSCHVDVTYTSLYISVARGDDEDPLMMMRVVRGRGWDYTKLQLLHELVRAITEEGMPLEEARARFDQIAAAPRIYRRALVTLVNGLNTAAVCMLFGGGPVMMTVAFLTGILVDRVELAMSRRGIAALFAKAATGIIPTVVAVSLYAAGADRKLEINPSLVVVAGIITALAGLGVVGAAQDALDGFYITASARSFEVVVLTTGIVIGIFGTLIIAGEIGVPLALSPYTTLDPDPVSTTLCAAAVGVTFAISAYTSPRAAVLAGVVAALGWAVFLLMLRSGFGPVTASATAAAAVGAASQVLARWVRVPSLALSTSGVISLMPGLQVYRGLWQLTRQGAWDSGPGIGTLILAFSTGMALAAGVSAGTFVARAWTTRGDFELRAVLRRATGARGARPLTKEGLDAAEVLETSASEPPETTGDDAVPPHPHLL